MTTLLRTPLLRSTTLGDAFGGTALLKAELFQKTGSFKPRGVLNRLGALTKDERQAGVISISAGNHAQALAFGAALEGIDALLVMWSGASPVKIAATRGYGASVDTEAAGIHEAFERLRALAAETGRVLVHPFDERRSPRTSGSAVSSRSRPATRRAPWPMARRSSRSTASS